jgi:hypothetical protein
MNLRILLAAVVATLAVSSQSLPEAQAEEQVAEAHVKVANNSSWTLDCRVGWGTVSLSFNDLAPGATSDSRGMPVSSSERIAVCKKRGVPPTKANMSPPVKFKVSGPNDHTVTCSNPGGDATKLVCSVSP